MNNQKVENPKVEVPSTINMNDRDYTNNILEELKNMSNNYSIALNEMSCDKLYEDIFEQFENTKDMAREVYNAMFARGWYSLERAEANKINEKYNECSAKLGELPK